jgi:DEAD/DEAH box helicase domain-containing protein
VHRSIIPYHSKWEKFLKHLRFVVIDEAHTYTGVFGTHVALVLRRLRRIFAHFDLKPQKKPYDPKVIQWILSTATIANPAELALALTGEHAMVVSHSGAAQGERTVVCWQPPLKTRQPYEEEGEERRCSSFSECVDVVTALMKERVKTLVFVSSRKETEQLVPAIKEALNKEQRGDLSLMVESYRGGYDPNMRTKLEVCERGGALPLPSVAATRVRSTRCVHVWHVVAKLSGNRGGGAL